MHIYTEKLTGKVWAAGKPRLSSPGAWSLVLVTAVAGAAAVLLLHTVQRVHSCLDKNSAKNNICIATISS